MEELLLVGGEGFEFEVVEETLLGLEVGLAV